MTALRISDLYSFLASVSGAKWRDDGGMNSEQVLVSADAFLMDVASLVETAKHEFQTLRASIRRTKRAIRRSREALVRTNTLIQNEKAFRNDQCAP